MIDYSSADIYVMCQRQSRTGCYPAIRTIWKFYSQVGEFFPLEGTFVLWVLYKSSPAALGDPHVGDRACSVSLINRSREEQENEGDIFFIL